MPLSVPLCAQLSLPGISGEIIAPPERAYGALSGRNIDGNMCRVSGPGLGSRRASPGWLLRSPGLCLRVPAAVSPQRCPRRGWAASPAWWGTGEPSLSQPAPDLVPQEGPQAGERLSRGVQSPSWGSCRLLPRGAEARGLPLAEVTRGVAFGVSKGGRRRRPGPSAPAVTPGAHSHLRSRQLGAVPVRWVKSAAVKT